LWLVKFLDTDKLIINHVVRKSGGTMKEATQQKIISLCGSQSELARRLGKNSQTVSVWFRTQVASTEVLNACRVLDWQVTHELRPIFTKPTDGLPQQETAHAHNQL
jgi:DNA-binding transcriptional regulator YdaS (Cro superfamily)